MENRNPKANENRNNEKNEDAIIIVVRQKILIMYLAKPKTKIDLQSHECPYGKIFDVSIVLNPCFI